VAWNLYQINNYYTMKKFYLLFFSHITLSAFAQISPPNFSADSGFYTEEFNLTISHSDQQATIIYTLDGSVPHLDNIGGVTYNYKNSYPENPGDPEGGFLQNSFETLQYQNPILIKDRSNDPNIISAISTSFESQPYLPQTPVFKSNVVRARAVLNGEYSPVVTKNYFVSSLGENRYSLPIVSLNINPDKLYSYENGLNVAGIKFDQWREDNPLEEANMWSDANFQKSGSSSELELNFCYLKNGVEVLNHNAGLRNHGNGSRIYPNRSVRLYAKNGYGVSKFNHSFFSDYNYNKFKRFILRNSGNDAVSSMFRDAFVQQSVKHLNVIIQKYQPVIMFINSEYNGIYNIRERYDEHFFDRVFDLKENKIDFLENGTYGFVGNVDLGDDAHFLSMMNYLGNNSLEDEENYDYVTTLLDPINFTDSCITYIFTANPDWPQNNFEYFRKRVEYTPETPYGHDGRWRWLIKDMDFSYNLDDWATVNYDALEWATKIHDETEPIYQEYNKSTLILRKLLENQTYKNYFINRFADLINTTFLPSRSIEFILGMEDILDPEISEHIHRWGMIPDYNSWKNNVNVIKNFAIARPDIQRNHIKTKFNISDTFELIADVSDQEYGYVKINTIDILPNTVGISEEPYPWDGIYFQGVPITVTAIPKEGYFFSHWEGYNNSSDTELVLSPANDIYLKAIFTEELNTEDNYSTQVKLFPNPFTDLLYFDSKTKGAEYNIYTIDGKHIKNGTIDQSTLNLSDLQKGIYILNINKENQKSMHKIVKK